MSRLQPPAGDEAHLQELSPVVGLLEPQHQPDEQQQQTGAEQYGSLGFFGSLCSAPPVTDAAGESAILRDRQQIVTGLHNSIMQYAHVACETAPSAGWYRLGYSAGIRIPMHCLLAAGMTHAWQPSLQVWMCKTSVMTWMLMVTATSVMMQVSQHVKTHLAALHA